MCNVRRVHVTDIWSWYRVELRVGDHLGRSEELVSRCVECDLAEPESLASLGGSAPGVVDRILSVVAEGIDVKFNPPIMHCNAFEDNSGALEMTKLLKICLGTKHLNINNHHFWEDAERGEIDIVAIALENQI